MGLKKKLATAGSAALTLYLGKEYAAEYIGRCIDNLMKAFYMSTIAHSSMASQKQEALKFFGYYAQKMAEVNTKLGYGIIDAILVGLGLASLAYLGYWILSRS